LRIIVWSAEARANLIAIRSYVSEFNPRAAERLAEALIETVESLAEMPDRGRSVGRGRRELAAVRPYLIRYRVETDRVLILRVRHGARAPE
jgi:plasmid stabilization system protein ParE